METLVISPKFTIEDIHKVRENNYNITKDHQRKSKIFWRCFFYDCCCLDISSTAFWRYKFLHVFLMFCCLSWLIRFVVYRSSQSINADGINRSGNFIMILNNKSSNLECSLLRNSFTMLRFLISMSIIITSEKNLFCLENNNCFSYL